MIELNQQLYTSPLTTLSSAAKNISKVTQKPELTGNVPTMENMLETYDKMLYMVASYKALLTSDAKDIHSAGTALTEGEAQAAKVIG